MKRTILLMALVIAGCGGGDPQTNNPVTPPVQAPAVTPAVTPPAQPAPPKIVFMGDSIVARWTLPAELVNAGIGGNTTLQLLARFDTDVIARKPALLLLEGGVNDLDREWLPYAIADNMAAMVIRAQAAGIKVKLLACLPTIYPHIKSAELNAELKLIAKAYGVEFIDTYSPFMDGGRFKDELTVDGVHPNAAGYLVLWDVLSPHLK